MYPDFIISLSHLLLASTLFLLFDSVKTHFLILIVIAFLSAPETDLRTDYSLYLERISSLYLYDSFPHLL